VLRLLRILRFPPQRAFAPPKGHPSKITLVYERDPDNSCALDAHAYGNQTSLRALPWRGARGFPTVFRAALVQTFASLVLRFAPDGRYPSPCALPPRLRQEASGM
jgi:hypothetical protein